MVGFYEGIARDRRPIAGSCVSQQVTIMSSPMGDILPKLSRDTHHIVQKRDTGSKFLF